MHDPSIQWSVGATGRLYVLWRARPERLYASHGMASGGKNEWGIVGKLLSKRVCRVVVGLAFQPRCVQLKSPEEVSRCRPQAGNRGRRVEYNGPL